MVASNLLSYYFQMMHLPTKFIALSAVTLLMITTNSCTTLTYYEHSISGHLEIMQKSRPIETILQQKNISSELRTSLQQVMEIRKFASAVLFLPDNRSYSSYADLGRIYVVWNVVATPEFSLEPLNWCYLVVGCLTYRGYFSKAEAATYAQVLQAEGYDVNIAGVTAYSTLGWFADPVINTMLRYDSIFLARVIFHELAHQLFYFADDTEFNEAFADTVAEYGVKCWLKDNNMMKDLMEFEQTLAGEKAFNQLIFKYKIKLEDLYHSTMNTNEMRQQKQIIFDTLHRDYDQLHTSWPDPEDYAAWFNTGINNAKLALVLTYKDLVPSFYEILSRGNYDLRQFYRTVGRLAECDKTTRRQVLASNLLNFNC